MFVKVSKPYREIECPHCWSILQIYAKDIEVRKRNSIIYGEMPYEAVDCLACGEEIENPLKYIKEQ